MSRLFKVVWFSIRAVYDNLFMLGGAGGLWLIMSVLLPAGVWWLTDAFLPFPLLAFPLRLASLLLIPPSTAAVYDLTFQMAKTRRVELADWWAGFRAYLRPSFQIAGVLAVSGVILAVDLLFYLGNSQQIVFLVIGLAGLWVAIFWFGIQIYLWPLLVSQEEKRQAQLWKNAALLALAFPFFAVGVLIVTALITALSVAMPPLLLVWMPLVAMLNNRAFLSTLDEVNAIQRKRRELEQQS